MSEITNKIERLRSAQRIEPTQCFAVPGENNIIDVINPATGRSAIHDQTLEQIQQRHPGAEVISLAHWTVKKAQRQNTPIEWRPTSEEKYDEMLNVLPPAFWERGLFLVGEPWDHHAITGRPRFAAYRRIGEHYFEASRPMMIGEARDILHNEQGALTK